MLARNSQLKLFGPELLIAVLAAILSLRNEVATQSLEGGWKGIKPLVTSKSSVEKLLGDPVSVSQDGLYWYKSTEGSFRMNYSAKPCTKAFFGRGDFSVPEETVHDYQVFMKIASEWSSFNVNPVNFIRDTSGDVLNSVNYYSRDLNIMISGKTSPTDGKDYFATVWFGPGKAEAEKFRCKMN